MSVNDNNSDKVDSQSEEITSNYSNDKIDNKRKHTLTIVFGVIILLLTNVVSYVFGSVSMSFPTGIRSVSGELNGYRKLFVVKDILDKVYSGKEVENEVLIDNAIKGMVNSLGDPYTVYMNRKEFKEFNFRSQGNYVGIGIQVAPRDGKIVVISVFNDSPAYKAGIYPGDFITKVAGQEVNMESIDKAINLIKGEESTSVSIVINRDGKDMDLNIKREKITILPVEYKKIDDKIGYIKINSFDEQSYEGVKKALENLNSEGLIIDLRGNPGGLLTECIDIVSEFVPEGEIIVSTDDKYGNKEVLKAKKGTAEKTKIVILGNSSSASASEVMIGALRDHGRATFVGEKTFGKGLVQRVFEIGDESGLKVTVSKYYTPKGEYINEVGIKPDVEVMYNPDEYIKDREKAKGDEESFNKNDPQFKKALEIIKEKVYN